MTFQDFTDYRAAWEFYARHSAVMSTIIPGKLWRVTVFA